MTIIDLPISGLTKEKGHDSSNATLTKEAVKIRRIILAHNMNNVKLVVRQCRIVADVERMDIMQITVQQEISARHQQLTLWMSRVLP